MHTNQEHNSGNTQYLTMTQTPIAKLITKLALPTTASQLVSVIYNSADTYFVSRISNSASAAVGVVFSLMSIIQAFGFGIGMGAGSLLSRRLGEQRDEEANKIASSALLFSLLVGVLLQVSGLLFLQPLMRLLGSTETMLPHSMAYGRYILIGAPVMCASFVLNVSLRSEGNAVAAMQGLCIGGLLNIILDPIFIFKLNMGVGGAALATITSQIVSCGILLYRFLSGRSKVKLKISYVSRNLSDYTQIFSTGFPTICRQGMASLASALMNNQVMIYGDCAVAAITISNKIYLLVRSIVLGIGQGFQPVAGYNYGAQLHKRVKSAFWFSCILGTVICSCSALLIGFHSEAAIGWFRNDPDVIAVGTDALCYACLVLPFMAYSTYVNQMYQCLGFRSQATFLASCRQGVFYIPLILILPRLLGLTGIQITQPLADFMTFLISIPFQIVFFRKYLKDT